MNSVSHPYTNPAGNCDELAKGTNHSSATINNVQARNKEPRKPHKTSSSESPEPTSHKDVVTMSPGTCTSSLLHHIGLSEYAVDFMRKGVLTCAQVQMVPYNEIRAIIPNDEHYAILVKYINWVNYGISMVDDQHLPTSVARTTEAHSMSVTQAQMTSLSPLPAERAVVGPVRIISRRRNDPYAFSVLAPEDSYNYVPPEPATEMPTSYNASYSENETINKYNSEDNNTNSNVNYSGGYTTNVYNGPSFAPAMPEYPQQLLQPQQHQQYQQQDPHFGTIPAHANPMTGYPPENLHGYAGVLLSEPAVPQYQQQPLSYTHSAGNAVHDPVGRSHSSAGPAASFCAGTPAVCSCLIAIRSRQLEFSSPLFVSPGQYVIVSGDRGQDLGLVLRVNKGAENGYTEPTGPQGVVIRLAYQKEVDYANGPLRTDEAIAADVCRTKVNRMGLDMVVHHAEFQYDKKKLTIHYESASRVDFVILLKEMYREFGCRIWMEKFLPIVNPVQPVMQQV